MFRIKGVMKMGLTVSGYDSSSISTLFSSLNSSKSNGISSLSSMTNMLGEYHSIQSGSYFKLLRSYYTPKDGTEAASTTKKNPAEITDKQLAEWKTDATELSDAANALLKKGTGSLFAKVEKKDADGKITYGYDADSIYTAVKKFADAYNDMIDSGEEASLSGVRSSVTGMEGLTSSNSALLKSVGISVNTKGHLSVDEATFKKSDMTVAKSLFQTSGGYGYQISAKASMVRSSVMAKASGGNYTKNGAISMNDLMSTYNSYI
ncbi:MAG: hypothetical protein ACLVFG_03145 [Lachnospiraceae bacterium]